MSSGRGWYFAALALCLGGLTACVTVPREGGAGIPPLTARVSGFPEGIRTIGINSDSPDEIERKIDRLIKAGDGSLDFLALSGGGAGGAYGAGVLRGMTLGGDRPSFEVVTGVSTGALIAPFAFLGPEWDGELRKAFASDEASGVLKGRGVGTLFSSSVFKTAPLVDLVDSFVTMKMVNAIADEAETGRILMVATTDLDIQQPVYWDIGQIAQKRDENARELIRNVLVASGSIPGVFSPIMLTVEADGQTYQEMHVDGSATIPFFIGPEWWAVARDQIPLLVNANVYILVNGQIQAPAKPTPLNMIAVISRAFESMMMYPARIAISEYASLSQQQNMNLFVTYIPTDMAFAGPLAFDKEERQTLFDFARTCSRRGHAWIASADLPAAMEHSRVQAKDLKENFGLPDYCPAEPRPVSKQVD